MGEQKNSIFSDYLKIEHKVSSILGMWLLISFDPTGVQWKSRSGHDLMRDGCPEIRMVDTEIHQTFLWTILATKQFLSSIFLGFLAFL